MFREPTTPLRCLLTPKTELVRKPGGGRGGRGGCLLGGRAGRRGKTVGKDEKDGGVGKVLSKGNEAMAPPYRFRGSARVRWMNVIEGCPVEFARAPAPCRATYTKPGAISISNEKCALISVTPGVARFLNGRYVRDGGGD